MATYRLFPSTNGPSSPVSYGGTFEAGVGFEVTSGGTWFEGYWWWVCPTGQPTASQTFALWQVYDGGSGTIVSAATVNSGALTAGQWNYIPLPNPIMLSIGGGANFAHADGGGTAYYIACTAFTGSFPDSNGQYGSGGTYAAGISNGPLTAFSDQSGSRPAPFGVVQGLFSTNASATSAAPFGGSSSGNFWMDVQVSDTAPSGYSGSYRIWPNLPFVSGGVSNDTGAQSFGTEFWLSQSCAVDNIWFWSPPGVTVLPSRCGIFNIANRAEVAGTDNTSPSWSGTAGSGWVSCSYSKSGVVLPAGKYRVAVYMSGGATVYQEDVDYFGNGPGASNIVNGPITVPSVANASIAVEGEGPNPGQTLPGNSIYQDGSWAYPDTFDYPDNGETRWVDIEVTPSSGGSGPPPPPPVINAGAFLTFFP
jgi:hypothetical protein